MLKLSCGNEIWGKRRNLGRKVPWGVGDPPGGRAAIQRDPDRQGRWAEKHLELGEGKLGRTSPGPHSTTWTRMCPSPGATRGAWGGNVPAVIHPPGAGGRGLSEGEEVAAR